MKSKIVAIVIIAAAAILAIILIFKPFSPKQDTKKAAVSAKAVIPAKKTFSKGNGGLTVKVKGLNDKLKHVRIKAFASEGSKSSIFICSFASERMQELPAGIYDIEIDTIPVKIYKNIKVNKAKETVCDLGVINGLLNVKALNSKNKEIFLVINITHPKSNMPITTVSTNKPIEIVSGVYNLEIDTLPRQTKNGVKVEAGKETSLDLGVVSGSIIVKTPDENGKERRISVRVKSPATNTVVASTVSGRSLEIGPGEYDVEILTTPAQTKKGVKVKLGEETGIEVTVPLQPQAQVKGK
jgi:hypothetical protein